METVTTRELTCIGCPMGCLLTIVMNGAEVVSVTGNKLLGLIYIIRK